MNGNSSWSNIPLLSRPCPRLDTANAASAFSVNT
nr:MAG TPA: hypothetical protein [Caudoviricetes sp.]